MTAAPAASDHSRFGFLRTTAFRVTLLHLGLTLLGTFALSATIWWLTVGYATRQAAQQIERDSGLLLRAGAISGLSAVALSIQARIAADRSGVEFYLLAAPDGRRLAGNLARATMPPGWRTLEIERPGESAAAATTPASLMALGTRLPGGAMLVVARDMSPIAGLEQRLWSAAGWVGGGALLLGLAGGLLIGHGVARRAAAMSMALAAVEAGDLTHRLPVAGGGDEFDRLAGRINATLDRLEATMAALRQVTDDIAHDLRTPLSRLRHRLEAAARPATDGGSRWREEAEAAIAECDAVLELFGALLHIAQVESGEPLRSGFARIDLSALVATVAEAYAPAAEERGQSFRASVAPGLEAYGDRTLVGQMLGNLIENAVRHGRAGGRVEVSLRSQSDGGAEVAVTDDGPGIADADRERVFGRFVRLDAARSAPGSGLGLALVRAVAALHGIRVTLEDASPGLRAVIRFAKVPPESQ
jgi:signal transduction histidine kinase